MLEKSILNFETYYFFWVLFIFDGYFSTLKLKLYHHTKRYLYKHMIFLKIYFHFENFFTDMYSCIFGYNNQPVFLNINILLWIFQCKFQYCFGFLCHICFVCFFAASNRRGKDI